jgi:hypothetical protein
VINKVARPQVDHVEFAAAHSATDCIQIEIGSFIAALRALEKPPFI